VTGFEIGGVPPIGHISRVPIVVDRSVLEHDLVYGGGGDEGHMLEITPKDIVRLTNALVANVTLHDHAGSTS
jgi:prolyl-tRNA editing enzyme YbaK/EbsC (Cys-tRNA(Pro) deacylase)